MSRPALFAENCLVGKVLLNKYTLIKEIGYGSNAVVYLATVSQSSQSPDQAQQVAVKVIRKTFLPSKELELLASEVSVMKQLSNPSIVGFIEDISDDPENQWIIMEYCNEGTLDKWVQQNKTQITDRYKKSIFIQILFAFKELHSKNIMHRDIKLQNILIHNGQLKLSDFGFCKQLESIHSITSTTLGTQLTMAPEVILHQTYNIKAEVYSLGVIFYQISKQKYPYAGKNPFFQIELIKAEKPDYSGLSENLVNLLQNMLRFNPADRIDFKDMLMHTFFTNDGEEHFMNSAFGNTEFELQKREFSSFYEKLQEIEKIQKQKYQMAVISERSLEEGSELTIIRQNSQQNFFSCPKDNEIDDFNHSEVCTSTNQIQSIQEVPNQNQKQSKSNPWKIKKHSPPKQQSSWISISSPEEFILQKQHLDDVQDKEAKCQTLVQEFTDVQQNYVYIILAAKRMVFLNTLCEENNQKFSVYIFPALLILKDKVAKMRQGLWDQLQGSKYAYLKTNSPNEFQKFEKQLNDDLLHIEIFDGICKNQIQNKSYNCYYKEFQDVLSDCFISLRKLPLKESYKAKVAMIVIDILLDLTNPQKIGGNRDFKDKSNNTDILKKIQKLQREACSYLTLACLAENPDVKLAEIEKRMLEGENYERELKDQISKLIDDVPNGDDQEFKDPMKLFLERKHKLLFQ